VEEAAELLLPNSSFMEFYAYPFKGGLLHESFFLSGAPRNSKPLELVVERPNDIQNIIPSSIPSPTSTGHDENEKDEDKSGDDIEADSTANINEEGEEEEEVEKEIPSTAADKNEECGQREVIDASQQAIATDSIVDRDAEEEEDNVNVGDLNSDVSHHAVPTAEFITSAASAETVVVGEESRKEEGKTDSTDNVVAAASAPPMSELIASATSPETVVVEKTVVKRREEEEKEGSTNNVAEAESAPPTHDWVQLANLFEMGSMSPFRAAVAEADDEDFEAILAIGGQLVNVAKNAYIHGIEKRKRDFTNDCLREQKLPLNRQKVPRNRIKGKQTGAENT
jgi:hypothetical protein